MKEGNLISEQQYISIIKEVIIRSPKRKLLLKGFPRTIEDLEMWDQIIKGSVNIKAVLYFEVSSEEMKKRELERKEKRFIDNENCIDKRIDINNYYYYIINNKIIKIYFLFYYYFNLLLLKEDLKKRKYTWSH